jgi:nucleoid DNA-binding protein
MPARIARLKSTALAGGDTVRLLPGLGVFGVKTRSARPGRNPRTGESISIPETGFVKFHPSKTMEERKLEAMRKSSMQPGSACPA